MTREEYKNIKKMIEKYESRNVRKKYTIQIGTKPQKSILDIMEEYKQNA